MAIKILCVCVIILVDRVEIHQSSLTSRLTPGYTVTISIIILLFKVYKSQELKTKLKTNAVSEL